MRKIGTKKILPMQSLSYTIKVEVLYSEGANTFMTHQSTGDKENFYLHVVRFYMPHIMQHTYTRHKLGTGVWTMEGFEFCNAKAKEQFKFTQITR
eukprot:12197559-Ditylum_brightwellii.AAC.1